MLIIVLTILKRAHLAFFHFLSQIATLTHLLIFFCSEDFGKAIASLDVNDHPFNTSDHFTVCISFSSKVLHIYSDSFSSHCTKSDAGDTISSSQNHFTFNWDDSRKMIYYDCTRLKFYELQDLFAKHSFKELACLRPDLFTSQGANCLYKNFIHALLNCSLACFNTTRTLPGRKRKWWWDASLKDAKALSLCVST